MELIIAFFDFMLHLDRHLTELVANYGPWVYALLFLIIFCETGLVVMPFLPGDSLLFVAGMLAGAGLLDPVGLIVLLSIAAVLGDSTNYAIGRWFGPRVFDDAHARIFKRAHLLRAQRFYERHGGKTIVLARFMPIVRTFAPFVAGIGRMHYPRFLAYNIGGGIFWVAFFITAGYFFGEVPLVKDNLTLVILGIVVLSIMPGVIEYWRQRRMSGSPDSKGL